MVNPMQKRFLLFLGGCIPSRLLFAYLAKTGTIMVKNILAVISFLISSGFLFIYFSGIRKTGLETGGEPIWWNKIRPVHALLYYLFTIMVFFVNANEAWKIIVFDTILGFVSFIIYHYKKGDFSKLIK
jgi:hypothetical protein